MFNHFHDHHARRFAAGEFGHGHGRHRGFHPFHRGGRRERVFDQGDLRFVILKLIAEKPRHGYELIKEIETRLGGAYSPSPGVVYPTLTLLEELGYVRVAASEGARKLYEITAEGEAVLGEHRDGVERIFARMSEFGGAGDDARPRIIMAARALKLALRQRLARGPIGEAETLKIVAALEALVHDVERS
ncbi:MAG: PadR family transcriptional regulator [Xanthobacteraceae bacterium]|nr:PadR family transcriptional regulator [Xanthobacteraceae bacterium]